MPTRAHFILACGTVFLLLVRSLTQAHTCRIRLCAGGQERRRCQKGRGGRAHKAGWKPLSGDVLLGFNCFCSFTLALCTELEVWHFKGSFYRNKCQERWVILISLKIHQGCQRNQNFVLKFSLQESRSLPTLWAWAAAWGNPGIRGQRGAARVGNRKQRELGIWSLFNWNVALRKCTILRKRERIWLFQMRAKTGFPGGIGSIVQIWNTASSAA